MNKEVKMNQSVPRDEIDIISILQTLWNKRKLIFKISLVFFMLGLFVAIFSPKEYTATSTFLPQTENTQKGGSLSGLASLAGINLSGITSSEIPPSLYPKIINSIQFKRKLLKTPITVFHQGKEINTTYKDFYDNLYAPGALSIIKKYTIGLPKVILNLFKEDLKNEEEATIVSNSSLIQISQNEVPHFKRIENQLEVNPDIKEGIVDLNFKMPEPKMAAEMAKAAEELLQHEVIEFKIQNAREQLDFTQDQFEEKERIFHEKQRKLSNYRDRNQNISSAVAMSHLRSLEADYNFAFNIYTEMAKQLESSKLQVSKNTPVFSIINPVSIPVQKSAPNRLFILIGFMVFGVIIGLGIAILQEHYLSFRKKWDLNKKRTFQN